MHVDTTIVDFGSLGLGFRVADALALNAHTTFVLIRFVEMVESRHLIRQLNSAIRLRVGQRPKT